MHKCVVLVQSDGVGTPDCAMGDKFVGADRSRETRLGFKV